MFDQQYEEAARLVLKLVREARDTSPAFRFPPVPLMADLTQIGVQLATNDAALKLVEFLVLRSNERFGPGRMPTVLMLQSALDIAKIPYETVSFSALGLRVGQG